MTYNRMYKNPIDLYLAVIFPAAIGKSDDTIIQSSDITAKEFRDKNPVFDITGKGYVTVGDIKNTMSNYIS